MRVANAKICEAAVRLVKAADYYSGGDRANFWLTANNKFYFIEVNARIQVEHPVTELGHRHRL